MEILNRIAAGKIQEGDLARLQDVGWTMTDASLCGLGQTAASAVMSAIKLWPELFAENGKQAVARKVVKARADPAKKSVRKKTEKAKSLNRRTQAAKAKTQNVKRKTQKGRTKAEAKKKSTRKTTSRRR